MSELAELLAGVDRIRLRQSRAIARVIDEQRARLAEGGDEAGYDFAVAVVAAAADRTPAEIEEMAGSVLELGAAVRRIMAMAGFALGEDRPPGQARGTASPPNAASGASGASSPPAAATRPRKSAA
jgi:hypothetical protein